MTLQHITDHAHQKNLHYQDLKNSKKKSSMEDYNVPNICSVEQETKDANKEEEPYLISKYSTWPYKCSK